MAAPLWTADITTSFTMSNPRLGRRVKTGDGSEYVFMKGLTSNAVGMWVTFNPGTHTPTALAANAVGPVAVSMGEAVGTEWGWFQVFGPNIVAKSDTVAGAGALYIDGTSGRVDDDVVSGDLVAGAFSTAADTSNVCPVFLMHPFVTNTLS